MTDIEQTAQLSGLFAGDGARMVRATVATGPIPQQAPPGLAELASPTHGDDGHLLDWHLTPHHADHSVSPAEVTAFRTWRATFTAERFIGERAVLISFLDWAGQRCDVSALEVLRLPRAQVDAHTALQMRRQLSEARAEVENTDEHGYGLITTPGRSVPSRALIPAAEPVILLALGNTSLTLTDDGVLLDAPATAAGPVAVRAWQYESERVRADTTAGEVEPGQETGRLLQILGRRASHVEVARLPLHLLLAPLLIFLRDATELASNTRSDLHLSASGL